MVFGTNSGFFGGRPLGLGPSFCFGPFSAPEPKFRNTSVYLLNNRKSIFSSASFLGSASLIGFRVKSLESLLLVVDWVGLFFSAIVLFSVTPVTQWSIAYLSCKTAQWARLERLFAPVESKQLSIHSSIGRIASLRIEMLIEFKCPPLSLTLSHSLLTSVVIIQTFVQAIRFVFPRNRRST